MVPGVALVGVVVVVAPIMVVLAVEGHEEQRKVERSKRERERENSERQKENLCVVCKLVCPYTAGKTQIHRDRKSVCVCVCVRERERERERD